MQKTDGKRETILQFIVLAVSASAFLLVGLLLIPHIGLEIDEVIFADPFYLPANPAFNIHVFAHSIPLMTMSYIGTLKTLLYWPIFAIFGANVFSVRVPMVLAGVLTILIFYRFASSVAGPVAAIWGSVLLATDPIFLVTNTIDWGPVALEHLLLVSGCLMFVRGRFAIGSFFFGLALWNKAIFLWSLAGLACGAVVVCALAVSNAVPKSQVVRRSIIAFLLGTLPFMIYNVRSPNETLGSNAHISVENLSAKLIQLRNTVNGSDLLDFIVAADGTGLPKPPLSVSAKAVSWIRSNLGKHRTTLFPYAIVLAFALMPLWWRSPARRAALFAIVFCVVTFLAMALTRGAGTGAHHIVLLWPMPHLLAGIALDTIRLRWARITLGVTLVIANLLVINQYVFQLERNGAEGRFTDALEPLSESLSEASTDFVYMVDWGMFDNLMFLHRGKLKARATDAFFPATPTDSQKQEIAAMLSDPHAIFLTHVRSEEIIPGVGAHLDAAARKVGYERNSPRVICDSNGRPIFELFYLRQQARPFHPTPVPPGDYDDMSHSIEYEGVWASGRYAMASGGTLTYSHGADDTAGLSFNGSGIEYWYTAAFNRGIAQVLIDGREKARVDLYAPSIRWQQKTVLRRLGQGQHTIEVHVLQEKNSRSSDYFVDLDKFVVTP